MALLMGERQGQQVHVKVGMALGGGIGVLSALIPDFSRVSNR